MGAQGNKKRKVDTNTIRGHLQKQGITFVSHKTDEVDPAEEPLKHKAVRCVDFRFNDKNIYNSAYTIRRPGAVLFEHDRDLTNTLALAGKKGPIVIEMHSTCAMIQAIREDKKGVSDPILEAAFKKLGPTAKEAEIAKFALKESIKILKKNHEFTGDILPMYHELNEHGKNKISILQGDKFVPVNRSMNFSSYSPESQKILRDVSLYNLYNLKASFATTKSRL